MIEAPEIKRSRRQRQADARREQLLEIALEVFAEKGVDGSTIKDIARRAEIAEGLIYHYFASKAELVRAVLEHHSLAPEIDALIASLGELPVREALVRMGHGYLEVIDRHRAFVTVVTSEAIRNPEVAQVMGQISAPGMENARLFFEERIARGELRPHNTAAVLQFIQGSLIWYGLMHDRTCGKCPAVEPEEFVRQMVEAVLSGLST